MEQETQNLLQKAEQAKVLFMQGAITYEQCRQECAAYVNHANKKAADIAKRFDMKPKKISLTGFMR